MATRRLQFRLMTLFFFVAMCAAGAQFAVNHRARLAKERCEAAWSSLDYWDGTDRDLYELSKACLNAELAAPFADREAAYYEHVERLKSLEDRLRAVYLVGIHGSMEAHDAAVRKAEVVARWRQEAERLLDENFPLPE